ncbi:sulfatase [Maribellus sp. YY47]|uniref:sulfatase family protein n=1 Tax=Maribellus sp. YY47 TaxID=2929486 RepID=UPI0020008825|nr:sulfatase [Maribellus sp. YY47]MCK3683486.1 sulfatase [Maribellus sp. YY47]
MNIKSSILVPVVAVALTVACNPRNKGEIMSRPNIIFLLTDDQRWDAMGAMGNEVIQTPNMDDLANNGVLFTNAHVTTSICCCSRASILSGQYVSRHGINGFSTPFSKEAVQKTYPLLLKENGYSIGFIGKYGVGNPNEFPDTLYDYWACDAKHQPNYENEDENGDFIHYTDLVNKRIMKFLDSYGKEEKPFCLSVSFKAPHCEDGDPRQFIYAERYSDLYRDVEIPLPETADDSFYKFFPADFRNPVSKGNTLLNEGRKRWELRFPNKEKYQESVRSYYRLISGVDEVIGNVRQKLEEMGEAQNTVILFMGDNGFYLGEHGLAGKWFAHQESVKVPFFIYDPRFDDHFKGQKVDEFAFNIDVAPTILSLAGVEISSQMQGINALNLLLDDAPKRDEFFYEHNLDIPNIPKSEAVISKKYKYIVYPELNPPFEELYNLEEDPHEKANLSGDPNYADVLNEYRQKLQELAGEAR